MSFYLNAAFNFSIGIAAIMGWIRIRKTDPAFFPFLLFIGAGFVNEGIGFALAMKGYSNAIVFNIYTLIAALLLGWQFMRWGLFKRRKWFYILQGCFFVGWTIESLAGDNLFNSYFITCYSSVVVLLCIEMINREIFRVKRKLYLHPVFLICMGLLVFHTYSVMVETFWIYGLNKSSIFRLRIYEIVAYINLFTNLLFAFAILWIPLKLQYILR